MIAYSAAVFCIVVNILVAFFQLALALGAPLGEYAWGGRATGKLPTNLRIGSAISFVVLLAIAGHYASIIGWLPSLLDDHMRVYSIWALTGFFALSLAGNLASKSLSERKLFVPVTGALVVANIAILVFYRLG